MSIKEIVRKPVQADIDYLIDNVRNEDVVELDALHGMTIKQVLRETPDLLEASYVWEVDGKIVCLFGITPLQGYSKTGVAWLLATDEFHKYTKMFSIRCKRIFKKVISGFDYIFNYIHDQNTTSIKWLKWLGFTMDEPEELGHKGAKFIRFEMVVNHV